MTQLSEKYYGSGVGESWSRTSPSSSHSSRSMSLSLMVDAFMFVANAELMTASHAWRKAYCDEAY
jgi:hypothetical protein